jgi:hypothetical protein
LYNYCISFRSVLSLYQYTTQIPYYQYNIQRNGTHQPDANKRCVIIILTLTINHPFVLDLLLTTECTEYDVDATNLFPSQLLFTVYIYLTKEITIKSQCIFITFYILPYLNKFNFNCSSSTHIPFHIPSLTLAILKSPKYIYYRKYKISNISTLLDSNIFPNIPMQIIFSIPVVYRHTVYTDNRQLPQPNLLSELLYCQSTFNRRIWSSSWGNNTLHFRVPSDRAFPSEQ